MFETRTWQIPVEESSVTACIIDWAHTPFGRLENESVESLVVGAAKAALDVMRLSGALPAAAATLEGADAPPEAERLFNGKLIAALTAFAEATGRGTLRTRDDQADVVLAAAAVTGLAVLARAGRLKTLGLDEGALLDRLEKRFTPVA